MILSGFLLLSVLLNGWLGYYLLQGRSWARITTIVLCSLGILVSAISLMTAADTAPSALPGSTCFGMVLNIVIVGLLSGQTAGHYFRYADY